MGDRHLKAARSEARRAERRAKRFFRSHVENCLKSIWEDSELVSDHDGDYPFRSGDVPMWVSVREEGLPMVRVFAYVAVDVKRTAKLLAELNDANLGSEWGRVTWCEGTVMAAATLPYGLTDETSLRHTLREVVELADQLGELITIVHGGRLPLAGLERAESDEDAA
jgi:hypothetical protein